MKHLSISLCLLSTLVLFPHAHLFAQEPAGANEPGTEKTEDLMDFMEEGMKEIDYYSLEELLDVQVEVASLFAEDELVVGSTVASISPIEWKKRGARRLTDAIENETSIINYTALGGYKTTAIRGYSRDGIVTKGVETLVDGVPIVSYNNGTNDAMPNFGLGTLNGIEIIKGPGSAIYGSDAFHGVIALKTFESEKDHYSVEGAGALPLYTDGNIKISQGLGDMFRVNASAGYNQQIASEELEYEYDTKEKAQSVPILSSTAQPASSGTGEYENKYRTTTGVLKLDINPSDKININIGGYFVGNKFDNFPGFKEALFVQLNDHDHTSQNSKIYIGRGEASYTFNNDITVTAKGYYWYWDMYFDFITVIPVQHSLYWFEENRSGMDLIVKQPDNALNLQWLIAVSKTTVKATEGEMGSYNEDYVMINPITGQPGGEKMEMNFKDEGRTINSAYAQTKLGLFNKSLFVLLGGRIDDYSDLGTQFTPRGGLIYLPTEKSSIKGLYGKAFRAPSGTAIYGVDFFSEGDEDIKPETIDIYELIFMYKEKKYKISLNGFYSNWENGIVLEYIGGLTPYRYTNSGKNRAYGGELNLNYPVEPFALDLGFSYVKSTALESDYIEEERDYETYPEYSVICGLHYFLDSLGMNFFLNNHVYLNMKESANPDEKDELLPYWRVDLNISKVIAEKLEMFLDIRNLFNRENEMPALYYPSWRNSGGEENGIRGGVPEPRISVLLRAGYKF